MGTQFTHLLHRVLKTKYVQVKKVRETLTQPSSRQSNMQMHENTQIYWFRKNKLFSINPLRLNHLWFNQQEQKKVIDSLSCLKIADN